MQNDKRTKFYVVYKKLKMAEENIKGWVQSIYKNMRLTYARKSKTKAKCTSDMSIFFY